MIRLRHLVIAASPLIAFAAQASIYAEAGLGSALSSQHVKAPIDASLRIGTPFNVTPSINLGPEITFHKNLR